MERSRKLDTFQLGKLIKYSPIDIILGYLHRDNQYIPINTLIATTRYDIFKNAINKCVPNIKFPTVKVPFCFGKKCMSLFWDIKVNVVAGCRWMPFAGSN